MKKTCLALLVAAVASGSLYAETVRVAVAANFTAPIKELAPIYEKATGDKLVFSFGATGAFYAQIKNGAPFDVLLAADSKTPAKAVKEGFGVEGTNYTYAIGKLVLWSSDAGFIKDESALKSDKLQKLAVANPKLAPYGEAAHQAMEALGMKAALTPKIVEATTSARLSVRRYGQRSGRFRRHEPVRQGRQVHVGFGLGRSAGTLQAHHAGRCPSEGR